MSGPQRLPQGRYGSGRTPADGWRSSHAIDFEDQPWKPGAFVTAVCDTPVIVRTVFGSAALPFELNYGHEACIAVLMERHGPPGPKR